jgi:hypothetical protein
LGRADEDRAVRGGRRGALGLARREAQPSSISSVSQRILPKCIEKRESSPGGVVTVGGLKINSPRWDTTLLDLVDAAKRWWSRFQGLPIQGRPRESGTWASAQQFQDDLRTAVSTLREQGHGITQEEVNKSLHCDVSTLKRWLKRSGTSWMDEKTR